MAADDIHYKDVLVTGIVKDGQFDFPFPIFSFVATAGDRIFYSLDEVPPDTEVLANIHVAIADYEEVMKLPQVVSDFQTDERVQVYWSRTKADASLIPVMDKDGKVISGKIGDLETDGTEFELAPFCVSNVMMTKDEVDAVAKPKYISKTEETIQKGESDVRFN